LVVYLFLIVVLLSSDVVLIVVDGIDY